MLEIMKSDAGSIPTFWVNEEYDKLITQASKEMDEAKRTELYKQAEQILLEECPVCPVTNEVYHGFVYSYVKNISTSRSTRWHEESLHKRKIADRSSRRHV